MLKLFFFIAIVAFGLADSSTDLSAETETNSASLISDSPAETVTNTSSLISGSSYECKKNEVISDCINSGCDARNCSQLGKPVPCVRIDPKFCKKGCVCKEGYVRSECGRCIAKNECPSCGDDPNAKPGCGVFCKRCANYKDSSYKCPDFCNLNSCECKPGFIFDDNLQKCVRPSECTPTCKKTEKYSDCINGGCSARNCSQLGEPVPCVRPKICIKGCICDDGYLRAENGTCIPKNKCPPVCRKPKEVYSDCINGGCQARNCSQLGKPIPCIKIDPKYCIKGCVCEDNYVRAANGTCIPKNKCPSCADDPNATGGCGVFCKRCGDPYKCPKICDTNGCDCKPGYLYDENIKKCVLPKQCSPVCRKPKEVYSECINGGCQARNCSQLGKPIPCIKIDPKFCIKGCVCEDGYVRAENGTCILKNKCPSCGDDPNATGGCGVFCNRCSGPIPCPRVCYENSCDCKPGYLYDDNIKKCVLPKKCTPECKEPNEEYSDCTNGGCQARNCSQLGKPIPCIKIDPKHCIKGCICKEDFVRAPNGTCVRKNKCPSCGDDPNATGGCGVFCERCGGPYPCPRTCDRNGCDCKPGYLYDENIKKCVLPNICTPVCRKPNEIYSNCINGGCDPRNCTQLGKAVPSDKVNPKDCIKGCICEDGYLRAENGTCIKKNDCPQVCQVNEVYTNCTNSGCGPRNCSQLGKPIPCVNQDSKDCKRGCVCKSGYLKADNGTCIPQKQCPTCNDDPNAESGCSVFCTRCSNYMNSNTICRLACRLNGCECRKGYIYDENIKKCVLPQQCTPICKKHEVFSSCVNGRCQYEKCSDIGQPIACPGLLPGSCIQGCVCDSGYLRAKNGTCIPKSECPTPCKKHEVLSSCVNGRCTPEKCSDLGKPIPCPDIAPGGCIEGCVCEPDYVRNKNGTCIPKSECPSCGDDPNATAGCGRFCKRCSNYHDGPLNCTTECLFNSCECKKGYIYDDDAKMCMLPDDCSIE